MNKKHVFFIFLSIMLVVAAIGSKIFLQKKEGLMPGVAISDTSIIDSIFSDNEPDSQVYVTLMAHIEEGDIYANCDVYPEYREKLLAFSKILHDNGYRLNLQVSYQFFSGVLNCETQEMQRATKGKNVIDFLAKEYGFEIDSHHEGSWDWEGDYNFADTRYIGGLVTDAITNTVGLVWNYEPQFIELSEGQQGRTHQDFTFYPEIISGAVHYNHHLSDFSEDDPNSGVWIPAGTDEDFLIHDPAGRMVVVGSGPHATCTRQKAPHAFATEAEYIEMLLDYIEEGKVQDQLLTASVAMPQSSLFGGVSEAAGFVRMLDSIREDEHVIFATYTEVVDAWQQEYDAEPQVFLFEDIDLSDYTCP